MLFHRSGETLRSALAVGLGATGVAIMSAGMASAGTAARITSVRTSGTSASPEITVSGRGFGARPASSPAAFPGDSFKSGCPKVPVSKAGHLYGTQLYITDLNARKGTYRNWTAGQYTPNQFLDCVGLVIDHWSNKTVRFHFGATYGQFFPGNTYFLTSGDRFKVFVRHATSVQRAKLG